MVDEVELRHGRTGSCERVLSCRVSTAVPLLGVSMLVESNSQQLLSHSTISRLANCRNSIQSVLVHSLSLTSTLLLASPQSFFQKQLRTFTWSLRQRAPLERTSAPCDERANTRRPLLGSTSSPPSFCFALQSRSDQHFRKRSYMVQWYEGKLRTKPNSLHVPYPMFAHKH